MTKTSDASDGASRIDVREDFRNPAQSRSSDVRPSGVGPHSTLAWLSHWSREQPHRPFVTWRSEQGETEVLSYGHLEAATRVLAKTLRARAPDGRVVGLLPVNDVPSVVAIFGILRAGMTCLFLDHRDPPARLRAVLDANGASQFWASPRARVDAADVGVPLELLQTVTEVDVLSPSSASTTDLSGDGSSPNEQPAFLFGTSGSTAASKTVVQPFRALASNAEAMRSHHCLDSQTILMGGLPLHHVNGVHFTLLATLHAGSHLILPEKISPLTYRHLIDEHEPNLASVVPPVLRALVATGRGWHPPESLRYFVSAAAPLSADLARDVLDSFQVRVLQGYGLSEATNFSTTVPIDLELEEYRQVMLDADIPSVGVALPGNEVVVLGPSSERVDEGQVGEICIRGTSLMLGYAGRADLTNDAIRDGWLHTGDIGFWRQGPRRMRYFFVSGRSKRVAKVRGESVSLDEVERTLLAIDTVDDAGCIAVEGADWGDRIVAMVSPVDIDLERIRVLLLAKLSKHSIPTSWITCDAIPRTSTGKLRIQDLRRVAFEHLP